MADSYAELAPEEEAMQPIVIRKLDRLETTAPNGPNYG